MEAAVAILVCGGLLVLGRYLGASLLVGLIASRAFGATALLSLGFLGGSSPVIYTFFAALLVISVATRRHIWRDLGVVFRNNASAWIVTVLLIYAAVGSVIFPRLFAGQTKVFVPSRTLDGGVFEVPLAPVSGNITQMGYLVLGGVTFLAICVLLLRRDALDGIRKGMFAWCCLHAGMGLIDFVGKLAHLGDLLAPIRTANYRMLIEVSQAGFPRIVGAYSEASSFGGVSLAALAFTYTYWKGSGSRFALWLSIVLLALLTLSTSSTAYAGLIVLLVPVVFSIMYAGARDRITKKEVQIIVSIVLLLLLAACVYLVNERYFDPLVSLFKAAIIDKADSSSGQERTYWNVESIQSFFDTAGLGVGIGSSRASSWLVAVISQLGVAGAILMAFLVAFLMLGPRASHSVLGTRDRLVVDSVRACGLAGLVSSSLNSGTADPGIGFFIALAVVSMARAASVRAQAPQRVRLDDRFGAIGVRAEPPGRPA